MFPLRDSVPSRQFPWVTVGLILTNIAVWVWEVNTPDALVLGLAFVPARVVAALGGQADPLTALVPLLTSMFLHAGLLHLAGNLWFLWIFGDNVEERLGRPRFLGFYLVCGLTSAVGEALLSPTSLTPVLGASGAVAGVLGAYLRLFPGARILTVVPIFVFLRFLELPALVFLGLWFVIQFVSAQLGAGGVAWWAHMVGFVVGLLLSFLAPERGASRRRAQGDRHRG